jgi:predicted Zn-dependent protease
MFRFLSSLMVLSAFSLAAMPVHAQRLVAPDEIVIYVHKGIQNTDFVEGLVCELGRVVAAPVRATAIDLPLSSDQLVTRNQFDPRRVAAPFAQATTPTSDERVFRFLLLPYDLKSGTFNYVFAETYMAPYFISVQSTIRLIPQDNALSRKQISDLTSMRLYKLMLKAVGRMAGLTGDGCILAFPRSLDELDAKSDEFCPDDKDAMVAAGVLKAKPFGACNIVAMLAR